VQYKNRQRSGQFLFEMKRECNNILCKASLPPFYCASSYLFSAFDFSLSSHALISDNLFSVATFARTASEEESEGVGIRT